MSAPLPLCWYPRAIRALDRPVGMYSIRAFRFLFHSIGRRCILPHHSISRLAQFDVKRNSLSHLLLPCTTDGQLGSAHALKRNETSWRIDHILLSRQPGRSIVCLVLHIVPFISIPGFYFALFLFLFRSNAAVLDATNVNDRYAVADTAILTSADATSSSSSFSASAASARGAPTSTATDPSSSSDRPVLVLDCRRRRLVLILVIAASCVAV
jgi:hypothetical protein